MSVADELVLSPGQRILLAQINRHHQTQVQMHAAGRLATERGFEEIGRRFERNESHIDDANARIDAVESRMARFEKRVGLKWWGVTLALLFTALASGWLGYRIRHSEAPQPIPIAEG